MGLLDKLWDDTVAGPRPDSGLGRLRKHPSRPSAVKVNEEAAVEATAPPAPVAPGEEDAPVRVTRSIMIKRPAGCPASPRSAAGTPPASPAGSTPPVSPFAVAGGRFRRKSLSDAYGRGMAATSTHTPPFEV